VKHILLYKTGETAPELVRDIGDYERWFARVLGDGVALEIHHAFSEPRHHRFYDAMVITGSPRSLASPEPWMDDAAATVRRAAEVGVPVLGVCFGHQLIGYAFGGQVQRNPHGWEVGTVEIQLTDEGLGDPLFRGLHTRLRVNQSHQDVVTSLGEARRLAGGEHTSNQAIAIGAHVRGVQFHPEMDGAVVRRLIQHRRQLLHDDPQRRESVDDMLARTVDTPDAEAVLRNFLRHFVL
jgi:GMP synthase (glutamine-hydrolysing)